MINLLYLVEHLRNLGYAVVSAVNGKEVLALLEKQPFDLILLDIQMPEMDGLECVQRIRSAAGTRYCKIPVIALTGYAMDKDLQLFHDVGIDDMVPKPINERVLDDKITSILNRVPLDPHSTC